MSNEPPFSSEHYEVCTDPDCEVLFAFRLDGTPAPHYHFTGSEHHPAWDVP
jgi:hypothetical protein